MKTMKSLLVMAAIMAAAILISCSEPAKNTSAPATAAEPKISQAEIAAKQAAEQAKLDEAERKSKEQEKQKNIKSAKAMFGLEKENDELDKDPGWAQEIKAAKGTGPFVEACDGFNKAVDMSYFFNGVGDSFKWDEVGITEAAAQKMFRQIGLKTAQNFLKIVNLPVNTRDKAGMCGRGEASFSYVDGDDLINRVIELLKDVKAEPKDIGVTSAGLRQLALKDFKAQIAFWRNQIATQQASQSDGGGILMSAIERAVGWGFTPDELALNNGEREKLKKK